MNPVEPSSSSSSNPNCEFARNRGGRFSKSQIATAGGVATRKSKFFTSFFLFPFSFVFLALLAPAQSTNDSSTTDFSSFQVIVDGNIFNPDRYGRHYISHQVRRTIPTFSLAGTMSYRKGMFAFFDGTGDDYRKALQQGGTIAGYTVKKIDFDGVQLQSSGKTIGMKVGAAMRLEGGSWEMSAPGEWGEMASTDSSTGGGGVQETSETSTNMPSSGDESDVLKRLMEKRKQQEQELK